MVKLSKLKNRQENEKEKNTFRVFSPIENKCKTYPISHEYTNKVFIFFESISCIRGFLTLRLVIIADTLPTFHDLRVSIM